MGLIFFISLLTLASYVSASTKCCPDGQAVLKDVCWEPKSNVTTPISLPCKLTLRFFKNYYVNDADELKLHLADDFDETFDNSSYCLGNFTIITDLNLSRTRPVAILCAVEEEKIN